MIKFLIQRQRHFFMYVAVFSFQLMAMQQNYSRPVSRQECLASINAHCEQERNSYGHSQTQGRIEDFIRHCNAGQPGTLILERVLFYKKPERYISVRLENVGSVDSLGAIFEESCTTQES